MLLLTNGRRTKTESDSVRFDARGKYTRVYHGRRRVIILILLIHTYIVYIRIF